MNWQEEWMHSSRPNFQLVDLFHINFVRFSFRIYVYLGKKPWKKARKSLILTENLLEFSYIFAKIPDKSRKKISYQISSGNNLISGVCTHNNKIYTILILIFITHNLELLVPCFNLIERVWDLIYDVKNHMHNFFLFFFSLSIRNRQFE